MQAHTRRQEAQRLDPAAWPQSNAILNKLSAFAFEGKRGTVAARHMPPPPLHGREAPLRAMHAFVCIVARDLRKISVCY
jgi:hypothetical protein